jgi:hypothetical protein
MSFNNYTLIQEPYGKSSNSKNENRGQKNIEIRPINSEFWRQKEGNYEGYSDNRYAKRVMF